jgi:hypothetical protein
MVGLGFSIVTPARAGELYRAKYYESVEKVSLASLVVIDRIIDLVAILLLGIYFVIDQFGLYYSIIMLLINSCIVFVVGNLFKLRSLTARVGKSNWIWGFVSKVTGCFNVLRMRNVILFVGMSLVNWIFITLQFYIIMNMYQTLKLKVVIASLPVIQLTNLLPITIGGIGVRESLSILVMDVYEVPSQIAAVGAFSLYLIDVLIPGIAGLILFWLGKDS